MAFFDKSSPGEINSILNGYSIKWIKYWNLMDLVLEHSIKVLSSQYKKIDVWG